MFSFKGDNRETPRPDGKDGVFAAVFFAGIVFVVVLFCERRNDEPARPSRNRPRLLLFLFLFEGLEEDAEEEENG